jgi:ubiquinone/menaquinone biosynthesis C-methylase UbiE
MTRDWDTNEAARRWDLHAAVIASTYGADGDALRQVILNPALLGLLPPVKGKRVLDAGCGEGYLSRMLAQAGASVVAVDYSEKMLEIARARTPGAAAIEYRHGNFEKLSFLCARSFDIVVSNVVLQDLAGYEAAIGEAYRVLRPGGFFILAILHPCFSTPVRGWVIDDAGEKLHWKVDRYFDETVFELQWPAGTAEPILQYHRTLASYFCALRQTGFTVDALAEARPSQDMLARHPEYRDDLRMCHFLIFTAVKPPEARPGKALRRAKPPKTTRSR